jgi:hypothetical protein
VVILLLEQVAVAVALVALALVAVIFIHLVQVSLLHKDVWLVLVVLGAVVAPAELVAVEDKLLQLELNVQH